MSVSRILSARRAGMLVLYLWITVGPSMFTTAAAAGLADLGLGLPPLPQEAGRSQDRRSIGVGRLLFFDKKLSADGKVSCSKCHAPELAFADGRAFSIGHQNVPGTRNAPSLLNVVYESSLFWDGRAPDLESQALMPLINPLEHAFSSEAEVISRVRQDEHASRELAEAFDVAPDRLSIREVTRALAAYERTLLAGGSPFDSYLYAGNQGALSSAAIRGLTLFRGRAQCATCHIIGDTSALLTDGQFHVSPTGLPQTVNRRLGELTTAIVNAAARGERREIERLIAADPQVAALGRFVVTLSPEDIGKFKTPSLRNVALTAPYMHDGSVPALEEVVDVELYGRTAGQSVPITLTLSERSDVLEFLRSLSSPLATDLVTKAAASRN